MKWFSLFLYLFFILIVIISEYKRPKDCLLWVLVCLLLPYIGLVLYLIFGSTLAIKLTTKSRMKRLKNYDALKVNDDLKVLEKSDTDFEVGNFNYHYNGALLTTYDDYEFFLDGRSHYDRLFKDIRNAKESLYIEFYTIHNDVVGHEFIDLLTLKASEGLKVIVLIDFIANVSDPAKMFKKLREKGGIVIRMKPFLTHFRYHRKLVVIDDKISYLGGMNIGKKYVNLTKKKNPWRDTQVRLTGPCSLVLERYFFRDLYLTSRRKYLDQIVSYAHKLPKLKENTNQNYCQFVLGGVDLKQDNMKMTYLAMIRSAKKSILIETPYFVPDESILDALKTAMCSGVEVKIIVAGVESSFFLDPVTTHYLGELLEYGALVYKYQGYIHAKTLLIDDEICVIGSVNMDQRSFTIDDEICGVFFENNFVKAYLDIFNQDLKKSDSYTYEEFLNRSKIEKFKESFFLLFSTIM